MDWIDDRTAHEMAAFYQQVAAETSAESRKEYADGFYLLAETRQEDAACGSNGTIIFDVITSH